VSVHIDAFGNSTEDFGTSIDQLTVTSDQGSGRSYSPAVKDDLTLNQVRIIGSLLSIFGFTVVYLLLRRHERKAHSWKLRYLDAVSDSGSTRTRMLGISESKRSDFCPNFRDRH
jgi:hypothetical protein